MIEREKKKALFYCLGSFYYIILKYNAELKGIGKQFVFSNKLVKTNIGVGQFTISNAANINSVWEITDIYNVTKLDNSTSLTLSPVIVFVVGFTKEIYDKVKGCGWNDLDIVANTLGILFGLAVLLVLK